MRLVAHEREDTDKARDDWETPLRVVEFVAKKWSIIRSDCGDFGFDIDVAASEELSKGEYYIDEEMNALETGWRMDGIRTVWCNPPFKHWQAFMEQAVYYAQQGMEIAFLVPPRTETYGWHKFVPLAHKLAFIRGRIPFILDGVPGEHPGAASSVLLFSWDKFERYHKDHLPMPSIEFWDVKDILGKKRR